MPSSGFMRSFPKTLWSPGTGPAAIQCQSQRNCHKYSENSSKGVIFLEKHKSYRLQYPRNLNNLALNFGGHFGLVGYSPRLGFFSFPFHSIVSPPLPFNFSVLICSFSRTRSFFCLYLSGFLSQKNVPFVTLTLSYWEAIESKNPLLGNT